MLLPLLEQNLRLEKTRARHFLVSISGGPDSVALCFALQSLREFYPKLRVSALHIHFGLRGKDSDLDAELVKKLCAQWKLPLMTHFADWNPKTVNQERTRNLRLKLSRQILTQAEWVEAHHRDDQYETILFRLFRGSGLKGLRGMQSPSFRAQRVLWRPFLSIGKADLIGYLVTRGIPYRVDKSNLGNNYQRNWVRNELIPMIESQFPYFQVGLDRLQQQVAVEEAYFQQKVDDLMERALLNFEPLVVNLSVLNTEDTAVLSRFFLWLFQERWEVQLDHRKVSELMSLLRREGVWNAPRGMQVRTGLFRAHKALVFEEPGRKKAPRELSDAIS